MLRRLTFTNFKTWEKADIEFGHVTGLFGTNSSGKTSLIQFLLMLKQIKEATDRALSLELDGNYVKLGLFGDVVSAMTKLGRSNGRFLSDKLRTSSLLIRRRDGDKL